MKIEQDQAQILAGVMEGKTTGAPLALLISNQDHAKWRGKAVEPFTIPRPGHADLSGAVKYGYDDLRPALERAFCPRDGSPDRGGGGVQATAGSIQHPGRRVRGSDRRDKG